MYTCDSCKLLIEEFGEPWGSGETQNDDGDLFYVASIADGGLSFTFKVISVRSEAQHFHQTCAEGLLASAIAHAHPKQDAPPRTE